MKKMVITVGKITLSYDVENTVTLTDEIEFNKSSDGFWTYEPNKIEMKDAVRFTEDYKVHFESSDIKNMVEFRVYEVKDATYVGGPKQGKTILTYTIDAENDVDEDEFDENMAVATMQGSVRWRGVWDERIYFDKEEYWGHELKDLSELFSSHIEPWCKNYIKQFYPHADE